MPARASCWSTTTTPSRCTTSSRRRTPASSPGTTSRRDQRAGGGGSAGLLRRKPEHWPPNGACLEKDEPLREPLSHRTTPAQAPRREELAPGVHDSFQSFSKAVFADGALPEKTKQRIAVAVAHVTQCPYCIKGHTKLAIRKGNTPEEIMEAIWVAAEMR